MSLTGGLRAWGRGRESERVEAESAAPLDRLVGVLCRHGWSIPIVRFVSVDNPLRVAYLCGQDCGVSKTLNCYVGTIE